MKSFKFYPLVGTLALVAFLLFHTNLRAQDCTKITSITVTGVSGGYSSGLHITGKDAFKCDSLRVTVLCNGKKQGVVTIVPSADGTWNTDFDPFKCQCGAKVNVVVECIYQGQVRCTANSGDAVKCENECTTISGISVESLNCNDRTAVGDWPVTIDINYTGTAPSSVYINYGDGSPASLISGPYSSPITVTGTYHCPYSAPPYNGSVTFQTGSCPLIFGNFSVDFLACTCQPISVDATQINECDVAFTATTSACSGSIIEYSWGFGDGHTAVTSVPTVTHSYESNGSYAATVIANGAGDNCSAGVQVLIEDCTGECVKCNDDPTDSDCGWKFWECFSWNLCWLAALLVALVVAARLILLANYGTSISVGGLPVTLDALLEALNLSLIIILLAICPCEVPIGIVLGVILAAVWLIVQWIYTGTMPPFILTAVIIAIALIAASITYRELRCKSKKAKASTEVLGLQQSPWQIETVT